MKVTIEAVAKAAGVSKTAVSFVLNNRQPQVNAISKVTRERIWQCANTLGYRKNPIAASLRTGMPLWIGVMGEIIFDDPLRWMWAPVFELSMLFGVQKELSNNGYFTLLGSRYGADDVESLDLLASSGMGGLIIRSAEKKILEKAAELIACGIPVVNIFPTDEEDLHPYTVDLDNYKAGFTAGELLARTGTMNPMYVVIENSQPVVDKRINGFVDAMHQYVGKDPMVCVVPTKQSDQTLIDIMTSFVQDNKPDAIMAMTAGVSVITDFALQNLNLSMPEDVPVIGFDCHSFRNRKRQRITSVGVSWWQTGSAAAEMVIQCMRNGITSITPRVLDPVVVPGDSTSPEVTQDITLQRDDPFMSSAEEMMIVYKPESILKQAVEIAE